MDGLWRFAVRLATVLGAIVAIAFGLAWWRGFDVVTTLFYVSGAGLAIGGLSGISTSGITRSLGLPMGGGFGGGAIQAAKMQDLFVGMMLTQPANVEESRSEVLRERRQADRAAPFAVVMVVAGVLGMALSAIV